MRLHYFHDAAGNFGDDLNPWLWQRLIPELLDDDPDEVFVGIGTLLNHRLPAAPRKHVFGSGFGYGTVPRVDETWVVHAVRGFDTARELGLPADRVITDAAVLVRTVERPRAGRPDRRVGFMPHALSNVYYDWAGVCRDAGLHFIDARWSVEQVFYEMSRCEKLVTEAMHGAIVADTLRIPWVPVVCYDYISEFKWRDWLTSLRMTYAPQAVSSLYDVERDAPVLQRAKSGVKRALAAAGLRLDWTPPPPAATPAALRERALGELTAIASREGQLSEDGLLDRHVDRYRERLEALRRAVRGG